MEPRPVRPLPLPSRRPSAVAEPFRHAFDGWAHAWRTQPNVRFHVVAAVAVLAAALALRLPPLAIAALVLVVGLVLVAELLNTALETAVDLVSPEYHPLAKIAKDVGAGAVLAAAATAVAVGALVFGGHLSGGALERSGGFLPADVLFGGMLLGVGLASALFLLLRGRML